MVVSDLSSVAAALRQEGYEARNLGQAGITVWKDGHGVFLSADELKRLNGTVLQVVPRLLSATESFPETGKL
jgi:hypothetical protein